MTYSMKYVLIHVLRHFLCHRTLILKSDNPINSAAHLHVPAISRLLIKLLPQLEADLRRLEGGLGAHLEGLAVSQEHQVRLEGDSHLTQHEANT